MQFVINYRCQNKCKYYFFQWSSLYEVFLKMSLLLFTQLRLLNGVSTNWIEYQRGGIGKGDDVLRRYFLSLSQEVFGRKFIYMERSSQPFGYTGLYRRREERSGRTNGLLEIIKTGGMDRLIKMRTKTRVLENVTFKQWAEEKNPVKEAE